jgi:Domain of unknown function (DUF4159)
MDHDGTPTTASPGRTHRALPPWVQRVIDPIARHPLLTSAIYAGLWVLIFFDWLAWYQLYDWVKFVGFTLSLPIAALWLRWARGQRRLVRYGVWTAVYPFVWQWLVYVFYEQGWGTLRAFAARCGIVGIFLIGLAWVVWFVEQASQYYEARRLRPGDKPRDIHPDVVRACEAIDRFRARAAAKLGEARARRAETVGLYALLPIFWPFKTYRRALRGRGNGGNNWNPLDLHGWFYGENARKLHQSLATLAAYCLLFLLIVTLVLQVAGCRELYEMPAGGGEQKQLRQVVKVQKVIKKKFVINPLSLIKFNPPPIDEIKLQLLEVTKHAYTVGYGQGTGAGFSGGTNRGMVRFIRLEYAGGDWDQDMGVGADLNMLIEYHARTQHKIAKETESRKVAQLDNFPVGKSPPMVYMTGQRNISLSKSEIKTLRTYLLDKHGMIFADNGGSRGWHNQFFSMMRQVLPEVEPVVIPRDDVIHRIPYPIPYLPYVAPHGGDKPWGWKVDGRWVCYYHPGDIGDAWSDGHAGVSREVWELCYQLGTNIIFYAHAEYNKWLDARKAKDGKE